MTRNTKIIAGVAVLAAGIATYMIGRKRRSSQPAPVHHPHSRHVTGVFSKAKNLPTHAEN